MFKKILPIILVLSLVIPSFVQIAQAGVVDSVASFGSCAAGGFISNLISGGLQKLQNWVTGGLSGFIGSSFTNVVPVKDDPLRGLYSSKEGTEDIITRCAAREILTSMGRNITNVARTGGRDGGPAWVRNWRNFRLDSQYRGEGIFKAMLASTNT